jgi:hypothetical protein
MTNRDSDPVRAAQACQKAIEALDKGYHAQHYDQLQELYTISEEFFSDDDAYGRFARLRFWNESEAAKPRIGDDQDKIILFVCRFGFRAAHTKGPRYNRAYKNARVLQRYRRKEVSADKVAQKLEKEGGSDFAFQLETEEHPRRARKEDKGAECDDETAESGDEESESEPRRQPTRAKGDASISKSITPRLSPDGEPVLDVEINSKRLERVLSLPEGGKARITVEHRGSLGSWKRIVAIAVADIEN